MATLVRRERLESAATILLGAAAAGLLHWPVPYNQMDMTAQGFILRWLIAGAVAGLAARVLLKRPVSVTAGLIAVGYIAAVMARVVVETMADPTDHNLWPFEVMIGGGIGLLGGGAGALLGSIFVRGKPEAR
jgi:uncharacterized membrane protein YeaQ/YmgE (transglycosylase-associated protein family)